MDILGKHNELGKSIQALVGKFPDNKSSSDEEKRLKRKKTRRGSASSNKSKLPSSSSGTTKAPCFLCRAHGHMIPECQVSRDKWVSDK